MTQQDILDLIRNDSWMMEVLRAARDLNLPDWMIGAGFVRNKVWDELHGFKERTKYPDIDLIYFDKTDPACAGPYIGTTETEKLLEKRLPDVGIPWSVTNQARMHKFKGAKPYVSSEEALSYWVETATCIAVKLEADDSLTLIAPIGIDDLVSLEVRLNKKYLTQQGEKSLEIYKERVKKKAWDKKWTKLKIHFS